MPSMRLGSFAVLLIVSLSACAPSAREVKLQRTSAYDTSFDEVWDGVVSVLLTDYPYASNIDKEHHQIVACWRAIEKPAFGGVLLYRVSVGISMEAPWRVTVSAHAGTFKPPQIVPIHRGADEEPVWVGGRTDRVEIGIYKKLQAKAVPATGPAAAVADPEDPVNIAEACVIRAEEFTIPARKGGLELETGHGNRAPVGSQLPGHP